MERFVSGDVITLNFPFSDLSGFKKRPALVISTLRGDDLILCQITSKESRSDEYSINLHIDNFVNGSLLQNDSLIRVNRLFTGDRQIVLKKSGHIQKQKLEEVREKLKKIISK